MPGYYSNTDHATFTPEPLTSNATDGASTFTCPSGPELSGIALV